MRTNRACAYAAIVDAVFARSRTTHYVAMQRMSLKRSFNGIDLDGTETLLLLQRDPATQTRDIAQIR